MVYNHEQNNILGIGTLIEYNSVRFKLNEVKFVFKLLQLFMQLPLPIVINEIIQIINIRRKAH